MPDNGLLTGFDYLVLRVECRTEHDDLRFPQLGELLRRATEEWLADNKERFEQIRAQAITEAVGTPDLIVRDRFRVAEYVRTQIDMVKWPASPRPTSCEPGGPVAVEPRAAGVACQVTESGRG